MNFEVDSDKLKNAETTFIKSHDDFESYIKYWREQIEQLKSIWDGTESEIFYKNMEEYLLKLDILCESKNIFGKAFKYSYSIYEQKDEEFKKELKKENSQYDDEKFVNKKARLKIEGEDKYEYENINT